MRKDRASSQSILCMMFADSASVATFTGLGNDSLACGVPEEVPRWEHRSRRNLRLPLPVRRLPGRLWALAHPRECLFGMAGYGRQYNLKVSSSVLRHW